ncbi:unnamed protein product [Didymodactylos carnosus]|uniref:DUF3533 domain-containing protein n=1 Tax=Didymodactylos carnosus TaxID=1234261 RepID=A0A815I2E2_9BILA|nr:unnamed protein product [Didymodactylos carnosus]CAF1526686.1 unnamed protein product [Didymodactylos carnosus]CAF4236513.1 unnamed protein product [Didymodactylos carnosus]CAF4313411.1 unnamed protein product [Didymodactylos carnosus]
MLSNQRGKSRFDLNTIRYPAPVVDPIHLWSKSPHLDVNAARKTFLTKIVVLTVLIWLLIFLVSAVFIGGGHNPSRYTKNLRVLIVDYDQQLAGTLLLESFHRSPPGNLTLHWIFASPSRYSMDNLIHEVTSGKAWAAVSIKANTTQLISSIISSVFSNTAATSVVTGSPSVEIILESGRSSVTVLRYLEPPIVAAVQRANVQYSQIIQTNLIQQLNGMSSSRVSSSILNLYAVISNPIQYIINDLHPIKHSAGTGATTIGYIYVYLLAVIAVGGAIGLSQSLTGKIRTFDVIFARLLNASFQGLIISLIFALIVLWFYGFDNYGHFVRYWMFNWLFFLTFAPIVALLVVNLGPRAAFVLTLFFGVSLSAADLLISVELQPRFYRIGYGLPFYHVINGARHLLFHSYSNFNADVGALLAWSLFAAITTCLTAAYRLHKASEKKRQSLIKEKQIKRQQPQLNY